MIPEWIKKRKHEIELAKAREEARTQAERAASLLIQRDGPAFWERFVNALKAIAADALPEISLRGAVSETGEVEKEAHCVVQIEQHKFLPASKPVKVDFFYSKSNCRVIRCTQLDGIIPDLTLSVEDNNIVVLFDHAPLSP